jgi:hypothetical protein
MGSEWDGNGNPRFLNAVTLHSESGNGAIPDTPRVIFNTPKVFPNTPKVSTVLTTDRKERKQNYGIGTESD